MIAPFFWFFALPSYTYPHNNLSRHDDDYKPLIVIIVRKPGRQDVKRVTNTWLTLHPRGRMFLSTRGWACTAVECWKAEQITSSPPLQEFMPCESEW